MLTGFIDIALPDRQQAQCRVAVVDGVAVVPVFRMLRRRGQQLVGVCRGLFGGAGIQSGLRQAIQGVETPYRVAASDILFPIRRAPAGETGASRSRAPSVGRSPLSPLRSS